MRQQLWTGIGAASAMAILILDGKTAITGAQDGIALCLQTVIPSLFPFILLSILLTNTLLGHAIPLLRPLGRLFHLPSGSESLLICAFLGGYPVGAQTVSSLFQNGQLPRSTADRMLTFCNNAGPAFLFGMTAAKAAAWAYRRVIGAFVKAENASFHIYLLFSCIENQFCL